MSSSCVVVVGSLNIDYIASVERLPRAGETIAANHLIRRFGGKGANQAVAAARLGARVGLIGCVGAGEEGEAYLDRLKAEGINTQGIVPTSKALTGTALIAVDRTAENMIIVGAGANGLLGPATIRRRRDLITSADVLLLQFEIPMASIVQSIRIANQAGVPVVLNPSPFREGFPWGAGPINTLILNAGEAEEIFGRKVARLPEDLASWQRGLRRKKVGRLLITRGSRSTFCITRDIFNAIPTLRVKPLDTVGAGDTFAGAFAASLAAGLDDIDSICRANCAGALATLKAGAQEAMPGQKAVQRALRRLAEFPV